MEKKEEKKGRIKKKREKKIKIMIRTFLFFFLVHLNDYNSLSQSYLDGV